MSCDKWTSSSGVIFPSTHYETNARFLLCFLFLFLFLFLFFVFCFCNTGRPIGLVKRGLNGVQGPQVGQPTSFIGNSTRTTNIALAPSTCNNSINHTICGHLIDAQIHARERTDTSTPTGNWRRDCICHDLRQFSLRH